MNALLLAAAVSGVGFPMRIGAWFGASRFFGSDISHYIFGNLGIQVVPFESGDFDMVIGHGFDTYMGVNWNNPVMVFNLYGGHWDLSAQFRLHRSWGTLRLYSEHECFHNIDQEDTLSEYMNDVKLGVEIPPAALRDCPDPGWLPASRPSGWVSLGYYTPRTSSFQKGQDFDWSVEGAVEMPLAAWRSADAGIRAEGDFYLHRSGDTSGRFEGEIYARYSTSAGQAEIHYTATPYDTQPLRSLEGYTCWGVRFRVPLPPHPGS